MNMRLIDDKKEGKKIAIDLLSSVCIKIKYILLLLVIFIEKKRNMINLDY